MRHWIDRYHAWLLLFFITATCLGGAWGISFTIPLPAHDEFNIVRWEVRHLPGKWLYLTNRFFGGGLSPEEEEQRLGRFLVLTTRIRQMGRALPPDELERLRRERDALENDVEAIIEGRLTASLEDAGLQASFPTRVPSSRRCRTGPAATGGLAIPEGVPEALGCGSTASLRRRTSCSRWRRWWGRGRRD